MSVVSVAAMPPKVREAFMLTEPAINAWDVNTHKILEDCIQNNKRVQEDLPTRQVVVEILCGVIIAFLLDLLPMGFFYLFNDHSTFAIKGRLVCVILMVLSSILVALHRKKKIVKLKQQGAEWRININRLIELTAALSQDERQQLYAVMLALGLEVQQGKRNAAMIRSAYDEGWTDGFSIGGSN